MNILNTQLSKLIEEEYLYYNDLDTKIKKNLKKVLSEEIDYNKIRHILDDIQDPHFQIINPKMRKFFLELPLAIVGENIIVAEKCEKYPQIKKGDVLKKIEGRGIEEILAQYGRFNTITLRLIKILDLISRNDKPGKITLEFETESDLYIKEKIEYILYDTVWLKELKMNASSQTDIVKNKTGVKYVKVPSLMDDKSVEMIVNELESWSYKTPVIFDLRYNLGGKISNAVKLLQFFIEERTEIYLKSRKNMECISVLPKKSNIKENKMGVLINNLTCSSLEFVFLRNILNVKDIVLIGEETCGMLDVATVYQLNPNYIMNMTTKKYVESNGVVIKEKAITPQIILKNQINDIRKNKDSQLIQALEILRKS